MWRLSWKWKLTLAGVALFMVFVGWIFTDGCHDYMLGKFNQEFTSLPESDRRDSNWAGYFLWWASFKQNVCGDYKAASSMYKEFCGLPKDYKTRAWDYVSSPKFRNNDYKNSFIGKCSPNGLTGWGPTHPDAPDAFYNYLCTIEPNEAAATTGREAKVYYLLFYDWHMKHSADHQPHPKFKKYWDKIRQKILDSHVGFEGIPYFDYDAKKAAPWTEKS